ncbi:TPA: hypothetical protein R6G41_005686 [Pseudomonas aeruginosa]|nr:hypothetical protein [Pseudomonas aeruginosa]
MNRIWSLAKYSAIFFMVAGFIIPVVILTVYAGKYSNWWSWEWLGRISLNPNDWSAFGALLAGVFSLLGAAATTSTLLLVVYQYKLSRESMVLNQYISHRDVFIGRLKALESNFDGKIFSSFTMNSMVGCFQIISLHMWGCMKIYVVALERLTLLLVCIPRIGS